MSIDTDLDSIATPAMPEAPAAAEAPAAKKARKPAKKKAAKKAAPAKKAAKKAVKKAAGKKTAKKATKKVAKKSTATQSFALTLPAPGELHISISSFYLDLVSLSFGGVTLTGLTKGDVYTFAVTPSNTPQLLTVVMKNTKTKDYGYSAQLDFAPIPEPAAWGLMIAGFGMTGGALRRRRTARVAIA